MLDDPVTHQSQCFYSLFVMFSGGFLFYFFSFLFLNLPTPHLLHHYVKPEVVFRYILINIGQMLKVL